MGASPTALPPPPGQLRLLISIPHLLQCPQLPQHDCKGEDVGLAGKESQRDSNSQKGQVRPRKGEGIRDRGAQH
jgi:hypothetical protein